MGVNTSKAKSEGFRTYNKKIIRKIILPILVLLLITTLFSIITSAAEIKDFEANGEETTYIKAASTINKFSDTIRDFISQRWEDRKWIPSLRLVTRYQENESSPIIEKSTRMRLVLPTSIDVNGDLIRDIRVWIIRRPAIDLNPPAISIKTTYLIRRLPGMENIKNDFFEIYLEYRPKTITKFFYLTKDIDRIRVGYQSPAGAEIPKTCIVVDKTVPHFLYPMKKTTHKISINPYSIVGEEQLNLLFALADLENGTVKSELIMQVNYTPATRVGEIIFEREKNKLFGRGQSLKITRAGVSPSNVTLFIKELMWKNFTIVKHGSITVENLPKTINLEWFIGRTGYININTHNDEVGRVRAAFNNTVFVGFVPKTSMNGSISWEDRTLIEVLAPGDLLEDIKTFNLSFDVYGSMILENFSLIATNAENISFQYLLESTASSLSLDLDAEVDYGAVTAEYWLFPINHSDDTTINMDIKNLKLVAENFAINVEVAAIETNTSKLNVKDSLNVNLFAEYFEVSAEDAHIFSSPYTIKTKNEVKGIIDLHVKDAAFSITGIINNNSFKFNVSFSSLYISTSGAYSEYKLYTNPHGPEMWWIWSEITGTSVVVDGSFEFNDLSFCGDNFLTIKSFKGSGSLSYNNSFISTGRWFDYTNITENTSVEGKGTIEIQDFYFGDKQNNVLTVVDASSVSLYILMIDKFSLSLDGTYSAYHHYSKDSNISTSNKHLKGNGDLLIKNLYVKIWNNTLRCGLFHLSGISGEYLLFSTNISSGSSPYKKIFLKGIGTIEIRDLTVKLPNDIITDIGGFSLSLEGTYSEYYYGDSNIYTINRYLKGNGNLVVENLYVKDSFNVKCDLFKLSGEASFSTNYSPDTSSYTNITSFGIGTIEVKNLNISSLTSFLHVDLFSLSGDFSVASLPIQQDNPTYFGLQFDGDAVFEIRNLESSELVVNIFDSVYFNVSGDFTFEKWTDSDSFDHHILWESKNGFTLEQFSIEFDSGIVFEIERKGALEGRIGPGYLHLGRYIKDDGFVFIDSSEINLEDVIFTFKSTVLNKGIRFSPSNRYFDADVFLLQWDSMTLDLPRLRAIPYNWYKTGSISTGVIIQLIEGDNIYDLWPLDDSGNSNEETENTEEYIIYNSGYGMEPLGNILPPNKPHKPKGPTGGVVFGRIVKGNSYTFTTTTDGNDQYISYKWDWGDGTYSSWSPFIKSGIGVTGSHTWTELGTYNIRVKAKNVNGEESEWSNLLTITVRKKLSDESQNELIEENYIVLQQNNQQSNPTNN